MDNSISFKGAFLIKRNPSTTLQSAVIPALVKDGERAGKGIQIIKNFGNHGDILYVLRDKYDKQVAEYIMQTKNIKFKYYPEVNTKCGFHENNPAEAAKILKALAKRAISTKYQLAAFIEKLTKIEKPKQMSAKESILAALNRSQEDCTVKTKKNIIYVYDNATHELLAKSSPLDETGTSYAYMYFKDDNGNSTLSRKAIKNGKEIFTYPSMDRFAKNYYAALKYNRELESVNPPKS